MTPIYSCYYTLRCLVALGELFGWGVEKSLLMRDHIVKSLWLKIVQIDFVEVLLFLKLRGRDFSVLCFFVFFLVMCFGKVFLLMLNKTVFL